MDHMEIRDWWNDVKKLCCDLQEIQIKTQSGQRTTGDTLKNYLPEIQALPLRHSGLMLGPQELTAWGCHLLPVLVSTLR